MATRNVISMELPQRTGIGEAGIIARVRAKAKPRRGIARSRACR